MLIGFLKSKKDVRKESLSPSTPRITEDTSLP
jgi:hypothetical protein